LRTPDRSRRDHPRGPRQPRPRCRGGRSGHRGVLLLPRGAGAPRRSLRHAVPAVADRGGLPPRPRPRARRRRPHARLLRRIPVAELKRPHVGEVLTEAEIVTWRVKEGDTVAINDIVVEIETAKSLVELPSPFAGVVSKLMVPEGEPAPVGTPIIAIGDTASVETDGPAEQTESDPYLGM